ncbi:MAG: hypothetical protein WA766_05660, partial [Candidatus Acidiferrales bacterium]
RQHNHHAEPGILSQHSERDPDILNKRPHGASSLFVEIAENTSYAQTLLEHLRFQIAYFLLR